MKNDKIGIPLSKLPKSSLNMISSLLAVGLDDPVSNWKLNPIKFCRDKLRWCFPPILEEVIKHCIDCAINRRKIRIVLIGPRGGGKSALISLIAYILSLFFDFDFVVLSGSLEQAKVIHGYQGEFMQRTDFHNIKSDGIFQTVFRSGAWIRCVACSSTQVRSKHPGGTNVKAGLPDSGKINQNELSQQVPVWEDVKIPELGKVDASGRRTSRGGGLIIDEECEADPEVVKDALPIVNTADPSVIIRASTFHELDGSFQDIVDHAEERGYRLFSWDIFDVVESCPYDCAQCYPEFAQDIDEEIIDPDSGKLISINKRKAYCGGKAKHNRNGFFKIDEVFQAWLESNFDRGWFEVEFMGRRPSAKDTQLAPYTDAIFTDENITITPDMPCSLGIDWGMEAGHKVFVCAPQGMEHPRYLINTETLADKSCDEVCRLLSMREFKIYNKVSVYPDAENAYNNDALQQCKMGNGSPVAVFPCNFTVLKRSLLFPNLLSHMQNKMFLIPRSVNGVPIPARVLKTLKRRLKRYRLEPRGVRKMTGMDEVDALMLALSHWGGSKKVDTKRTAPLPALTGGKKMTDFSGL